MARLQFARAHQHWTPADWRRVIWSDESKFNLYNPDGGITIRRPPGKRYDEKYTRGTMKFGGGGSVMVWVGFTNFRIFESDVQGVSPVTHSAR